MAAFGDTLASLVTYLPVALSAAAVLIIGWLLAVVVRSLVRRALERGIFQGWDLHPHQLLTRYLATYAFFREGYPDAAARLTGYLQSRVGTVLDEPATARALAWFLQRGVQCGAIDAEEVIADVGVGVDTLTALAHPARPGPPAEESA